MLGPAVCRQGCSALPMFCFLGAMFLPALLLMGEKKEGEEGEAEADNLD